jgi:hypothetical protein
MRSPTNNWWTEHSFYMGIIADNINKTWDLLQTTDGQNIVFIGNSGRQHK